MKFNFYVDIDPETGWYYIGDAENCEVCFKKEEELEGEGKVVIRRCSTCINNDD